MAWREPHTYQYVYKRGNIQISSTTNARNKKDAINGVIWNLKQPSLITIPDEWQDDILPYIKSITRIYKNGKNRELLRRG
jgi:hypothetical protein